MDDDELVACTWTGGDGCPCTPDSHVAHVDSVAGDTPLRSVPGSPYIRPYEGAHDTDGGKSYPIVPGALESVPDPPVR